MRYNSVRDLTAKQALEELAAFAKRRDEELARVQEEYARDWPQDKRDKAEKNGNAMKGGKFPIENQEDLNNAATLSGNSSIPRATVIAHIKAMAKKHGLTLPKSLQPSTA